MLVSHQLLKDLVLLVDPLHRFDSASLSPEAPLQLSEGLEHLPVLLPQVPIRFTEQPVNIRIVRERKFEKLRIQSTSRLPRARDLDLSGSLLGQKLSKPRGLASSQGIEGLYDNE